MSAPTNPWGSCNTGYSCNNQVTTESVASWLSNLTANLFGVITKTLNSNGTATWSAPCAINSYGIPGYPVITGEGILCYFLRILPSLAFVYTGGYNASASYSINEIVLYSTNLYIATGAVAAGITPPNSPWGLFLPSPTNTYTEGLRSVTASTTATAGDQDISCTPTANMVVTLNPYASYLSGKVFTITNNSNSYSVTISPTSPDVIVSGATTYSNFVLAVASSVKIISTNDGNWRIL